ncbi:MAG TPA: hypothetical protein VET90_08095, partial [Candidatus Binatus sp.]|nr:hypothetical protein [Candidatus Binatus sp.]
MALVGRRLAVVTLHDAHHRLTLYELDGRRVAEVALPGIGTIDDLTGRPNDDELHLSFVSFATPPTVLAVRVADGAVREVGRPDGGLALPWRPRDYVTDQVFVASADG